MTKIIVVGVSGGFFFSSTSTQVHIWFLASPKLIFYPERYVCANLGDLSVKAMLLGIVLVIYAGVPEVVSWSRSLGLLFLSPG